MRKKITLHNIKQYIEGNKNMFLNDLGLRSEWYKEQIIYRILQCQDCLKSKRCKYCGCSVPGKLYVNESCNNGDRFPNIMDEDNWVKFKEKNGIK